MTKTYPQRIEGWRTSDGRVHINESSARWWQGQIESAAALTASLESGADLASACAAVGWFQGLTEEDRMTLAHVTRETKLVISHLASILAITSTAGSQMLSGWQCRDQPGYQVIRANPDGTFFVHGDAGSWSGPYGSNVDIKDVIRYARDTFARFPGEATR